MERENELTMQKLNRQLNNNNKGATLVTVLLVASIVAILVTAVLAIVILNVYMRKADLQGQEDFYDAESALEEIKAGLAVDVSNATSDAYLETLANYTSLGNDAKKTKFFNERFKENMEKRLLTDTIGEDNGRYYKVIVKDADGDIVDGLASYFKETAYNEDKGYGAEILTADEDAHFNSTETGIVLYNVQVRYTDDSDYVSQIKTDINIDYPPINFENALSSENILTYGLIANNQFIPHGAVDVTGNAYIGGGNLRTAVGSGTSSDNDLLKEDISKVVKGNNVAADFSGAKVTFNGVDNQETNVICGGNLSLKKDSVLETVKDVMLWTDAITIEDSDLIMGKGSGTYVKDDIVLGKGGSAKLIGKLIMFGNPWVAIDDDMINSTYVKKAAAIDPPSYSSSILVAGSGGGMDLSGLDTMVIGGSAYVDTESVATTGESAKNKNVVLGQSIALQSDQRAYLVPATVVKGLANPLTKTQFESLREDIARDKYDNDVSKIQPYDYVNYDMVEPTINVSVYQFYMAHFLPQTANPTATQQAVANAIMSIDLTECDRLQSTDIEAYERLLNKYKSNHDKYMSDQKNNGRADDSLLPDFMSYEYIVSRPTVAPNAYPTGGGYVMYFFLKFNSVGENFAGEQNLTYIPAEAFYNGWYRLYNSTLANALKLEEDLYYYTKNLNYDRYGIKLPSNVLDKTKMYFTGNILSYNPDAVIIQDIITQPDFSIALNIKYSKQSAYYQDAYYTLNKNLSTRYATLTEDAMKRPLFDNIIRTNDGDVGGTHTMKTSPVYYVSTSGDGAVVVDNKGKGTFNYNSANEKNTQTTMDADGNIHSDAKINVIIATGDVEVQDNFSGMIIAGGNITVKSGCKIVSDSERAARALKATKYSSDDDPESKDNTDCPANFVRNAAAYLLGGAGRTQNGDTNVVTLKDCITYKNWTRQ